jgi:hypothetical protein
MPNKTLLLKDYFENFSSWLSSSKFQEPMIFIGTHIKYIKNNTKTKKF